MAQEFKAFDKKYARHHNSLIWDYEKHLRPMEQWPNGDWFHGMKKPAHDVVRYAVYEAEGFEDWQKFRVSLKGFSTGMKLARLAAYFQQFNNEFETMDIRVWNYLDSMKRGGLIDQNLKVLK